MLRVGQCRIQRVAGDGREWLTEARSAVEPGETAHVSVIVSTPMNIRTLGRTGIEVSPIAFGAGPIPELMTDDDSGRQQAVLQRAVEAGINWIDTAPFYGNGASETALGWLLHEVSEERRPYISTKVRFDSEACDFAGQAERSMAESLYRLKMDR